MNNSRLGQSSSPRPGLSGLNDDSSVVSLKSLVARSNPTLSTVQNTSSDDSGLIDLKKLMANAPPSSDALPPVLAPTEAGLFAMPEATPLPLAADASNASKQAQSHQSHARAKWLAAATFVVLAAAGTLGFLHTRTVPVADVQSGVAAPGAIAEREPNKFVETPQALEPASNIVEVVPSASETHAPVSKTRQSGQLASRNQTRPDATTTSNKSTTKLPPPAPCDLMCEMRRAAKKK
jgi:hypothetical protein